MKVSTQLYLDRLQYNELFGLFPPHIRARFYNENETRVCKAGEIIFRRGDEGPWLAAILAGRVRVRIHSLDGKEMLLAMVERGEIFGERALLDGLPRATDAIAEEETTLLIIKRDDFLPVLFNYPEAMYSVIKMLGNRILSYTRTLELYALENLPTRLAYSLLYLGRKYGKDIGGRTVINAGLNQSDLGQLLASSRESINKQLKSFTDKGYITIEGEEIILLDLEGLENIVTPPMVN